MKLIKTLKTQFLTKLPNNDIYIKSFVSICVLTLLAGGVWIGGPYVVWGDYAPLLQPEKRIYVILFLFLIWLLKLLAIDLDAPNRFLYKHAVIRKKLHDLQTRFEGAMRFLKKTTILKQDKTIRLNQLPWYLLVGPSQAGKSSLLANSNINFILQRRVQNQKAFSQNMDESAPVETCDWWVTRESTIVDIPGKYVCGHGIIKDNQQQLKLFAILWRYFLGLIKYHLGKNAVRGILIALPLPEILKKNDKNYQTTLRILFHRLNELQKLFSQSIPCYLIITKCDLLPGFKEFFAESGNEEITQAWGVALPETIKNDTLYNIFDQRFDTLIKKLNQQLLWRLHQERNPMARPYIKDFPLQVEHIKGLVLDFIKKFSQTNLALSLQGVYLTSALQNNEEPETNILEENVNDTQRALQIFKEPLPTSRAYFIKQFIVQGLASQAMHHPAIVRRMGAWKSRTAIAISVAAILGAAFLLGKDFKQGIDKTYSIQNYLADYQSIIQQNQDPDEHLITTINLLDTLQTVAKNTNFKLNAPYLLSFYSHKAQHNATLVYKKALQNILLPEVKSYLEEYLQNPVNKNAEYVYAVLKAYLMLGNRTHFKPSYVQNTLQEILPSRTDPLLSKHLLKHVHVALNVDWAPISLDENIIQQTRKYLSSMPSFQLGYIILKNINNNNISNEINLGTNLEANSVFISRQVPNHIPKMFTVNAFAKVISHETVVAAKEATLGNWIIGNNLAAHLNPEFASTLLEQLRIAYVNNYIDVWESLIANIQLATPKHLPQLDIMITTLVSSNSPLLSLLHTLHDNTYFEPITSSSPKLQKLDSLVEKNQSESMLYEIFASLQSLHQYIQAVETAEDEQKAAFEAVSHRMLSPEKPDALERLWLIAGKSPEPIKSWLDKLANSAWHFLMQDAGRYLDTSWQEQVVRIYQTDIADRYPFVKTKKEIPLQKFSDFFGKPGTITNFYDHYLQSFIDDTSPEWRWKSIHNEKLPFSNEKLHQIQQAIEIHRLFFSHGDNKLSIQFALQPFKFGKNIKSVKFNINDIQVLDKKTGTSHVINWPNTKKPKKTSLYLTLVNKKIIYRDFSGDWAWFKLVSQSYESAVTKKEILLNLFSEEQPAQYLMSTETQINPFISLNWRQFSLPEKLEG